MAQGVYRDGNVAVVDYGKNRSPVPRQKYEANGYMPPFDSLPTKDQHGERRT